MQMFFAYYVLFFFSSIFVCFLSFLAKGSHSFCLLSFYSFTFVGQLVGRSVASFLWLNLLSGDTLVAKQWRRQQQHAHVDHILLPVKWQFGRKRTKWQKTRCRCLLLFLLRMFHIRTEKEVREGDRRRHSVQHLQEKRFIKIIFGRNRYTCKK